MRVALTNGQWAEILDADTLTNDEFDDLTGQLAPLWDEHADEPEWKKIKIYGRARVAQFVKEWSLDFPLPSDDVSVLGKIKRWDYLRLSKATAESEARLNEEPGTDPLVAAMNGSHSSPSVTS